ncbi:MAG: hypothetical protein CBD27_01110 [Rhodospirillaceae bacterium TMED167]|nr:hypothetical protein [Rhodospirillaceae bacterium]OUW30634.1 MAG: hypothetical protein CBD27_01110 [Rhodospirillaceae bacterium TMED167]
MSQLKYGRYFVLEKQTSNLFTWVEKHISGEFSFILRYLPHLKPTCPKRGALRVQKTASGSMIRIWKIKILRASCIRIVAVTNTNVTRQGNSAIIPSAGVIWTGARLTAK